MAGGKLSGDDDVISEINITPFVDVVLVLLIIFIVTAGMIANRGVPIELPESSTAEPLKPQESFNILVAQDGRIMLDGSFVTAEELRMRGAEAVGRGEQIVATISADKGVVYNHVVGVMDALRSVGVADFALQLEPLAASPSSP